MRKNRTVYADELREIWKEVERSASRAPKWATLEPPYSVKSDQLAGITTLHLPWWVIYRLKNPPEGVKPIETIAELRTMNDVELRKYKGIAAKSIEYIHKVLEVFD